MLLFYNPNVNTIMFVRIDNSITHYYRKSKKGNVHPYKRMKQIAVFSCDNCGEEFKREKGKVDPRRLSDNYFHVCPNCDPKRFAQKRGVEKRLVWNLPANSDKPVSSL
jgi:predicted RNA-binding Zn-ribbon protein involved in translation (DUF1610 family)